MSGTTISSATEADEKYFGFNEGLPMRNPESQGMLKGDQGFMETACPSAGRSVPYFVKNDKNSRSANQRVYDQLKEMNKETIDLEERSESLEGANKIPDGIIEVVKAREDEFEYQFSINTSPYFQYHRNNG